MKFMDLTMGQQFELDGEIYARTGPLVASHVESSKQRFMARYVTVKPVGEATQAAPRTPDTLSSDKVNMAFDYYHAQCLSALEPLDAELSSERVSIIRRQIEQARLVFLDTLNKA